MSDIELNRLRNLRTRSERLRDTLISDLKPFRHDKEENGFRRKPDSESLTDDVNITTSCSCLMGLTLSGNLREFYGEGYKAKISSVFGNMVKAPWMSSGLTEDNAFTTTLIIRVFGFLAKAGLISKDYANGPLSGDADSPKRWESRLEFSSSESFLSFAKKVSESSSAFPKFLYSSFPETLQSQVSSFLKSGRDPEQVQRLVVAELTRLIRGAYFYDVERFKHFTPSDAASKLIHKSGLDAYHLAQLNRLLLHDFFAEEIKPLTPKSLRDISIEMTSESDFARFGINEYPPTAALLYWFVDGVDRGQVLLDRDSWVRLCNFAIKEFGNQRSRVVAKHAAIMDPVAMAMSACLCARLRKISEELLLGVNHMLPSMVELESSIIELFDEQTPSGIWPKYFPLFHYQDAGSNFCFTFELLEAVLSEFGGNYNHLLTEGAIVSGLEKAVEWCESNRLRCSERSTQGKPIPYEGWNSGGNLETLRRAQPESWATAVVHMFLWELVDVLSRRIQQRLLDRYGARKPAKKWKSVENLLDIDLLLDQVHTSLKDTLSTTIVQTFALFKADEAEQLRRRPVKNAPLSALLFGPPGTSKTEVAKAIAKDLSWSLVEIDPSNFLQDGFANIYVQAEKIFQDVMDMSGVVVLFDEMDALVQKRDADTNLDTESKFLTTFMLPKLAKLHDRGQIVFLMATNFQANFDDAVKRAGRFDFLLCMGPPTFRAKCDSIHTLLGLDEPDAVTKAAGKNIEKYAADSWVRDQLSLYTYGEFQSLLSEIGGASDIADKLVALGKENFVQLIKRNSQNVGLKLDDLQKLNKIKLGTFKHFEWKSLEDLDAAADLNEQTMKDARIDPNKNPAIKYILDRKQSRRQYFKSVAES